MDFDLDLWRSTSYEDQRGYLARLQWGLLTKLLPNCSPKARDVALEVNAK